MTRQPEIDLRSAYFCCAEVIRRHRHTGEPIPRWLRGHFEQLDFLMKVASPRHEKTEIYDLAAQLELQELIGADEAAELLGCPLRTVQRRADEFGGRLVGKTWVFLKAAIVEAARRNR